MGGCIAWQEEFEVGDEAIKAVDAREKRDAERKAAGEVEEEDEDADADAEATESEVSVSIFPTAPVYFPFSMCIPVKYVLVSASPC